jgi:putative exporter of polyketide antibiotics
LNAFGIFSAARRNRFATLLAAILARLYALVACFLACLAIAYLQMPLAFFDAFLARGLDLSAYSNAFATIGGTFFGKANAAHINKFLANIDPLFTKIYATATGLHLAGRHMIFHKNSP